MSRSCELCGGEIPRTTRRDAIFCKQACQKTAQARRRRADPSIRSTENRKRLEAYHMKTHGSLDLLDNPENNPKDQFWRAKQYGYRSMLEVSVADQLTQAGVAFQYEAIKIEYMKEVHDGA